MMKIVDRLVGNIQSEEVHENESGSHPPPADKKAANLQMTSPFVGSSSVSFGSLLPLSSVELGRLVLDPAAPWLDFCPSENRFPPDEVATYTTSEIHEVFDQSRRTAGRFGLWKGMIPGFKDEVLLYDMVARESKIYYLLNSGAQFSRICQIDSVREWLETVIKHGWRAHMIVGIRTVFDPTITRGSRSAILALVSRNVPGFMGKVVKTDTSAELLGETAAQGRERKFDGTGSFTGAGELVLEVMYRKVEFKWFSGHTVDTAWLGKGSWRVFSTARR